MHLKRWKSNMAPEAMLITAGVVLQDESPPTSPTRKKISYMYDSSF